MDHEFVEVDGININATHLLGMDKEQAHKELLANDQLPGKNETEKKAWIDEALGKAKIELDTRAADRKKAKEAAEQKQKQLQPGAEQPKAVVAQGTTPAK